MHMSGESSQDAKWNAVSRELAISSEAVDQSPFASK